MLQINERGNDVKSRNLNIQFSRCILPPTGHCFPWVILDAITSNQNFRQQDDSKTTHYPWKASLALTFLLAFPSLIMCFRPVHISNYGLVLTLYFWVIVAGGLFSLYSWARFANSRNLRTLHLATTATLTTTVGILFGFVASMASPV